MGNSKHVHPPHLISWDTSSSQSATQQPLKTCRLTRFLDLLVRWQEKIEIILSQMVVKNGDLPSPYTHPRIRKKNRSFLGLVFLTDLKSQARQTGSFPHEIGKTTRKVWNHQLHSCPRHTITPFEEIWMNPLGAISWGSDLRVSLSQPSSRSGADWSVANLDV